MMVTILILYSPTNGPSALFSDDKYRTAYETLYSTASQQGAVFCRAPFSWYNQGHKNFDQAWFFKNSQWILKSNVTPDIIYDKTLYDATPKDIYTELTQQFPFINDPEFNRVASSKYTTSVLLPQYFKPYYRVTSQQELTEVTKKITGGIIVAKPEFGSGGKDVVIDTPQAISERKLQYPLLLQEFIDSSHGIPGITPGHHDLRLVFINEELIYSYIRIPKAGSLLANIAQGGTMEIVEQDLLPPSLHPLIRAVQNTFKHFPRKIYTIDILFDENTQPWIVELNTMPGIYFSPGQEATRDYFYKKLTQALLDSQKTLRESL